MKIAIELPDDLYRRAEAEAALRGCKLDRLIEQATIGRRKCPRGSSASKSCGVMKKARGIVESDVSDLGSNPDHLENFGRNIRGR
jgi:hypothetical protein